MPTITTRLARALLGALLVALTLAACGGTPAAPAATAVPVESPEQRVKGFFDTFSQAINDPQIGEEARRTEWVDKLAAYAPPDEREQTRTSVQNALGEFTAFNIADITGQSGLDVRMEITFAITETRLVEETADTAVVEILNGSLSMKPVGPDVEQLGDTAAMLTQNAPIGEFMGDTGSEDRLVNLVKVDGVWYIVDVLNES